VAQRYGYDPETVDVNATMVSTASTASRGLRRQSRSSDPNAQFNLTFCGRTNANFVVRFATQPSANTWSGSPPTGSWRRRGCKGLPTASKAPAPPKSGCPTAITTSGLQGQRLRARVGFRVHCSRPRGAGSHNERPAPRGRLQPIRNSLRYGDDLRRRERAGDLAATRALFFSSATLAVLLSSWVSSSRAPAGTW
jgi:hypothetical protein